MNDLDADRYVRCTADFEADHLLVSQLSKRARELSPRFFEDENGELQRSIASIALLLGMGNGRDLFDEVNSNELD